MTTRGAATERTVRQSRLAAVFAGLLLLALVATVSTRAAEFFLDDYLIDAIVRSVDDPLWFLSHRHFFAEHLHRPLGFVSWWALAAIAPGPGAQLLGNALLLAACAMLLALLLTRWQVPLIAAAAAAALCVCHPGSVVFAGWSANRFELLSTAFGLACLSAWTSSLQRGRARDVAATLLLAIAALLSKESAVVLAPVALAMALTAPAAKASTAFVPRRLAAMTAAAAALGVAGLAGYRYLLDVRLPREVIEANQGWAWAVGIGKWWRHLPEFLLGGIALPPAVGWSTLAVLPPGLLALAAWSWHRWRSGRTLPYPLWPVLAGCVVVLAMPVIQVGHLSLAAMVFTDPAGRMTGLFVERFYFQGLIGLLMIAAGLAAPMMRGAAGALLPARPAGRILLLAIPCVLLVQLQRSLHTTDRWPATTRDILQLAQAANAALIAAGADRTPGCRARFTGTGSPVFSALAEGMMKSLQDLDSALGRCIIETEARPMISMTHASRIGDYALAVPIDALPAVGRWYFLRPVLAEGPNTPVTHDWHFDRAAGRFAPGP